VSAIRSACERAGVSVDAVGHAMGNATARPEQLLNEYDVVFAKGRAALEAVASGAAVILCDAAGLGPMVTSEELARLRRLNFGIRTLRQQVSIEGVLREIDRYDSQDAREVTTRIREDAGAECAIDHLLETYRAVIDEYREVSSRMEADAEWRAASDYLQWVTPRVYWSDSPRAAAYTLARRIHTTIGRAPGIRVLARTAWARRLGSMLRNWRQRVSKTR
jgi:hypothetical protein